MSTDYNTMLAALDAVDAARRRSVETLSLADRRASLLEEVSSYYQRQGIEVPQASIEQGVDDFLANDLALTLPRRPVSQFLARLWVFRARVMAGCAIAAVAAGLGVFSYVRLQAERSEQAAELRAAIESSIDALEAVKVRASHVGLPAGTAGGDKVHDITVLANDQIAAATALTAKSYPSIAGYNAQAISQEAETFSGQIAGMNAALEKLEPMGEVYRHAMEYRERVASLKLADGAPEPLREKYDAAVAAANTAITALDAAGYAQAVQTIEQIRGTAASVRALNRELDALRAGQARGSSAALDSLVAQTAAALQAGRYDEARQFVGRGQQELRFIQTPLTMRIVDRPGVKSGQNRLYTDASGSRVSGYYLIVEAITPDGDIFPMNILNEETGQIVNVNRWGERVPQEVFEKVKRDKSDGRIDDNVVATKAAGANTFDYRLIPQPLGRITSW